MIKGKTFVKWAGGKRGVIDELVKYSPKEKRGTVDVVIITNYVN